MNTNKLYNLKFLSCLAFIAALLTFIVIGLGAYTRLMDAGLGCPDWPGCYGHFVVPHIAQTVHVISRHKAWAEMVHRYFAGTLALCVILVAVSALWAAIQQGVRYLVLSMALFALVIYQALLGMWTVTLKLLPIIVTQHLLGGMTLFALLVTTYFVAKYNVISSQKIEQRDGGKHNKILRFGLLLALVMLYLQIALGAWTSTNYASLSCPDFPFCDIHKNWHFEFLQAFNLLSPLGINYEGGVLNSAARMTIQTVHRFGALIVSLYLFGLIGWIYRKALQDHRLRYWAKITFVILIGQICLGISNVIFQLPLVVAELHTLMAALLLAAVVAMNHQALIYSPLTGNRK